MGELAEDSLVYNDKLFTQISKNKRREKLFRVQVVKRDSMKVFWETTMVTKDVKECQTIFRKQYGNIRKEYTHDYALLCTQIQ